MSSRLCIAPSGVKSCISIASILFARMDTFQQYDASNVRTRNRPSKKRSNLWKARIVNSGRVNTLSHDSPTSRNNRVDSPQLPTSLLWRINELPVAERLALPPVVPTQESAVSDSRRDCLAYASECVRLAGLAHDLQIREELLNLADDWMAKGIFRTTSDPQLRH